MSLRRFADDISGTSDANGAVTIAWHGMTGEWSSLLLIMQATGGSPSWTVNVNGRPVNVGRGPNAPLRLPALNPGDAITVTGTNIPPSTLVLGHFEGYASDVGIAELPLSGPEPSTLAVDISTRPAISVAPTGDTSFSNGFLHVSDVTGFRVGDTVLITQASTGVQSVQLIKSITAPTQFQAKVGGNLNFYGVVPFSPAAGDLAELLPPSTIFVATATPVPVQEPVTPRPWQAATVLADIEIALANGATAVIVAAVNGVTLYLHSLTLSADAIFSATLQFQDTNGTNYGSVDMNENGYPRFDFKGAPLPVGLGFQIHNAGGAATSAIRGSLAYSTG